MGSNRIIANFVKIIYKPLHAHDMWSLGILLYKLILHDRECLPTQLPVKTGDVWVDSLLNKLLVASPADRLSATDLLNNLQSRFIPVRNLPTTPTPQEQALCEQLLKINDGDAYCADSLTIYPNLTLPSGWTALGVAAASGNKTAVKQLIDELFYLNCHGDLNGTTKNTYICNEQIDVHRSYGGFWRWDGTIDESRFNAIGDEPAACIPAILITV